MNTRLFFLLLNIFSFVGMLYVNYISVALPLGGNSQLDLSIKYENLFVPAGFTFSIWGIIYLFISIFLVGQAFSVIQKKDMFDGIGYFFSITCLLNALWLVVWHYEYLLLSLVFMLGLLVTLIFYYLKNDIGSSQKSFIKRLQLHAPFSLYLGWISVATIANITAVLVGFGWNGGTLEIPLTIIMIAIAGVLGVLMQFLKGDILFGLVIVWASYGIYFKRSFMTNTTPIESIIFTCLCVIGIVSGSIIFNIMKKRRFIA